MTASLLLPASEVEGMLRLGPGTLLDKGLIAPSEGDVSRFLYAIETVDAFLEGCARNFGDSYPRTTAWDLHYGRERLLTTTEVMKQFGMTQGGVSARVVRHRLLPAFIIERSTTRSTLRYPSSIVLATTRLLETAQIAAIFGVNEARAATLVETRMLCPAQHPFCQRRKCIVRYIEKNRLAAGLDPDDWIASAQHKDGLVVTSLREFSDDLTLEDVTEAAEAGMLAGVWLPSQNGERIEFVTTPSGPYAIQRFFRRREREWGGGTPRLQYGIDKFPR